MSTDKNPQDQKDIKIADLPNKKAENVDDAKVKGGMKPRGITYTGDEVDTQTGD